MPGLIQFYKTEFGEGIPYEVPAEEIRRGASINEKKFSPLSRAQFLSAAPSALIKCVVSIVLVAMTLFLAIGTCCHYGSPALVGKSLEGVAFFFGSVFISGAGILCPGAINKMLGTQELHTDPTQPI